MFPLHLESRLAHDLLALPERHDLRWKEEADQELRRILFRSLATYNDTYLRYFFPKGRPNEDSSRWSLREAQGAVDGAEYLPSARGTACGHIFKHGENSYSCKTCAVDDTCVMCTKCFESSDHEGHQVYIQISPGNTGCCDCGDREAWKTEVVCSIHTDLASLRSGQHSSGKAKEHGTGSMNTSASSLPPDLVDAIRTTISRGFDFMCDVFSCSPEQMRLAKTEATVRRDEERSRLTPSRYGMEDRPSGMDQDFCLVLWNDEKHTIDDVMNQVARACAQSKHVGREKAHEVDDVGRSVIYYSKNVPRLIEMAAVIEQLKLTVTIRSARDTFREQMCATIVDWLADISGCSVGSEPLLLRSVICEEMLKPWKVGSQAGNKPIGLHGIHDHEEEEHDNDITMRRLRVFRQAATEPVGVNIEIGNAPDNEEEDDEADENLDETDEIDEDDLDYDAEDMDLDTTDLPPAPANTNPLAMDIELADDDIDVTEVMEARHAGYPAPPPPPPHTGHRTQQQPRSPLDSDDAEMGSSQLRTALAAPFAQVPRTPSTKILPRKVTRPGRHWTETPAAYRGPHPSEPCEDLWQRIRLDWLVLYDLRLWKTLRNNLRHLYITTVVVIPQFKRILGLRFAGLYTPLAELYLIADREPDHSITNLSLQILTTPTITEEVVERGNFLSNLMAILYTFLTTRQVGYPDEVDPKATLAFDSGTVTNRRVFHFFMDLKYLFQSEYVQKRIRTEYRYLLQFLELVKLHQGICPNKRAVGEHVEYESDAWFSASLVIKETDRLCRHFALAFQPQNGDDDSCLRQALRTVAQVVLSITLGFERRRFSQAEIKSPLTWHTIGPFTQHETLFKVPEYVLQKEHISFHHPLHYLLSWLIEHGLELSKEEVKSLFTFTHAEFRDPMRDVRIAPNLPVLMTSDHFMSAIFDPPLRVCAWLAQTKAGMWVRNGITLRHQANSYRSVSHRDLGYQRDIFMVQAGLTLMSGTEGALDNTCETSYLAQMVDRFQMTPWTCGDYAIVEGFEEPQQVDVLEDFYHLLVIALSERSHLVPSRGTKELTVTLLQHDIAHALCFKPLPYSDIISRVTEKVHESDEFDRVLASMAVYKAPEGLSDTGVFELKPDFVELIDPYFAHFTRNAREEAETIYRKYKSRKTGQQFEEIVYEPQLQAIPSGMFQDLAAFTRTSLFVQIIFAGLHYSYLAKEIAPNVPSTRIETFMHMVLHLLLIAVAEERPGADGQSFILLAAQDSFAYTHSTDHTLVSMLEALSQADACTSCHPTINHILHTMRLKHPGKLATTLSEAKMTGLSGTDSPASQSADEKERRKQAALARQAKVMAQMREQQNSFLKNQGLGGTELADDLEDFEDKMSITQDETPAFAETKTWDFPAGTCILCQEATDDDRMFGTFAFIDKSNILRSTPVSDPEYLSEVLETPQNLDQPYSDRPFGVSSRNKSAIQRAGPDGSSTLAYKQQLSKGFPQNKWSNTGPISTSCGHMMHFKCFEVYYSATTRRHQQQIARNHPENIFLNEFICPLCKALGNTFLPVVWKAKDCEDDTALAATSSFEQWLHVYAAGPNLYPLAQSEFDSLRLRHEKIDARLRRYAIRTFPAQLLQQIGDKSVADDDTSIPQASRYSLRRATSISSLFRPIRGLAPGIHETRTSTTRDGGLDHKLELGMAYNRAHETFKSNKLDKDGITSNNAMEVVQILSLALGMSISTFEISQRGSGPSNDYLRTSGSPLINAVSEQTLTHLRIVTETTETALAISALDGSSCNFGNRIETVNELLKWQGRLRGQLFGHSTPEVDLPSGISAQQHSVLTADSFLMLTNWLTAYSPSLDEAVHITRLYMWAEVVKSIMVITPVLRKITPSSRPVLVRPSFESSIDAFLEDRADAAGAITEILVLYRTLLRDDYPILQAMITRYALAFVRKSLVLLHVRYGVDFEAQDDLNVGHDELTRTCRLMHIEHPLDLLDTYARPGPAGDALRHITRFWVSDAIALQLDDLQGNKEPIQRPLIQLPHPAIFELIGLPMHYDVLTEEAIRRRCPTTGKEVTDPAICLFCGEIFCSQAVCCMKKDDRGGCWQHMQRCGLGNSGMFINIRKCMVLLMHGSNGSFLHAPYLDKHGEPDPTLRRHHQLFLNQKRYDKLLRDIWLTHGIQNVISRKLEADINPGGWDTL